VNPTGLPNRFVELDLIQEHLNFWIKVAYKAKGSNASWDWLEIISPCINLLRKLAKNFNDILGSDQGTRHTPPDLVKDISTLMDSLSEHKVYQVQPGRVLDDDELVKDVIGVGLQHLSEGAKNPIREFNKAFESLQKRRKMKSVSALAEEHLTAAATQSAAAPMPSSHNVPPTSSTSDSAAEVIEQQTVPSTETAAVGDEDVQMGDVEEPPGELDAILDNLIRGEVEATLPCLTADDVDLDMDEVEVEAEDDASDDDSEWESDPGVDEAGMNE